MKKNERVVFAYTGASGKVDVQITGGDLSASARLPGAVVDIVITAKKLTRQHRDILAQACVALGGALATMKRPARVK